MPSPGKSTQFLRRILRKAKSVAMLVRQPIPETPNFYVMTPAPLPFYGKPWLRKLNSVLVRTQVRAVCFFLRMGTPVVVATIPTAWDVVNEAVGDSGDVVGTARIAGRHHIGVTIEDQTATPTILAQYANQP